MSEPVTYDDLNEDLQLIVDDVRIVLGDTDSDYPWFGSDEVESLDNYVVFMRHVMGMINVTQPRTDFTLGTVPNSLYELVRLGLMVTAIESRMNRWVEVPSLSGYSGPYADESQFLSRWQTRHSDIKPVWIKAKNTQKLQFLPGGAGTVNSVWSSQFGGRNFVPSVMRGMPTWYWGR